jgi:hypothetical protein
MVAAALAVAGCLPGTPDSGFGDGGTARLPAGRTGAPTLASTPDGGVVAMPADGLGPVKLGSDGAVDADWGAPSPVPCPGAEIHRDGGGRYVVGCDGSPASVVRFTADGAPDPTFGDGGIVPLPDEPEASGRLAVVPLPGREGGYLAARARLTGVPDAPVELALARVEDGGRTTMLPTIAVDGPTTLPPPELGHWEATLVAAPATAGALVAVNPRFVLDQAGIVAGVPATVLRLDGDGTELGRFAGPAVAGEVGDGDVTALAELPDGRLALAASGSGVRFVLERPMPVARFTLVVTTATGAHVTSMAETPDADPPRVTSLLGTAGGERLWTAGRRITPYGTWAHDVVRYATDNLSYDRSFGTNGTIMVDGAADLALRLGGAPHVYASGTDEAGPLVTRIWGQAG